MRLFLGTLFLLCAGIASAQEITPLSPGQTLYLPIYSEIWHGDLDRSGKPAKTLLSALVSIRNTDFQQPIRVLSARYYDTAGKPLKEFVPTPASVPAMGTLELFIEQSERQGGSGANFVIVWDAVKPVNPPLVEAVHVDSSARPLAFTTRAQPIRPVR